MLGYLNHRLPPFEVVVHQEGDCYFVHGFQLAGNHGRLLAIPTMAIRVVGNHTEIDKTRVVTHRAGTTKKCYV